MNNQPQPQKIVDTKEASGDLDSGFFCDLVGVTTAFPKSSPSNSNNSGDLRSGSLIPFESNGKLETIPEPEPEKTKIPLYKQGGMKTLVLFGLVALPMFVLGLMLFGGNGSPPLEVAKTTPESTAAPAPTADFKPDPRFSEVQSKLAMQEQEQAIRAAIKAQEETGIAKQLAAAGTTKSGVEEMATQRASVNKTPPLPHTPTPSPPHAPNIEPPPTNIEPPIIPAAPVAPVAIPTFPAKPRIITRTIVKTKIVTVRPPRPTVVAARRVKITANPPLLVASNSLSGLGQMPKSTKPSTQAPTPVKPHVSWQQATAAGVAVFSIAPTPAVAAQTPLPNSPTPPLPHTSTPIPVAANPHRAIAGQNRAVSLVTPIQILAGEPAQEVLLNLDQGFVDMQGRMLLPAGTKLLAQINIANNGLLRIGAVKALVGNNEYSIPPGSLIISNAESAPAFAQLKQFGQDEVGRRDLRTFLMGAAQGIGEVLTQPSSQTQVTANGTVIASTENQQNIMGGILKGGANPLVQQWMERNQREIERIDGATRLWHLPTGTKFSLYAVRPFEVK
jgi:hypothetical protein